MGVAGEEGAVLWESGYKQAQVVVEGVRGSREQVVDDDDDDGILSHHDGILAQGDDILVAERDKLAQNGDMLAALSLVYEQHQMDCLDQHDIGDC